MHKCLAVLLAGVCWLGVEDIVAAPNPKSPADTDSRLAAAARFVRASDRYLHQSELRRGMTGYGLTVMAGAERVRFDVEIVSVLVAFSPKRDVILARLSGQDLHASGIIAGMSGSPVYITHGGREKLVGAVAYGWTFQKSLKAGPLCGIQPISQMLAVAGIDLGDADPATTQPAKADTRPTRLSAAWRQRVFAVPKSDFALAYRRRGMSRPPAAGDAGSKLTPLMTPLTVGGFGDRAVQYLAASVRGAGLVPVQSGQMGPAAADEVAGLKLEPGGAMVIPMVTGDQDASAIGTVTDVIGETVIGFGHPMYAQGRVRFPMATGYVHAVVASLNRSFKLGAPVKLVGEIRTDEMTAVAGVVGPSVEMIPVRIGVQWPDDRRQDYSYRILRERSMTSMLALTVLMDSVWGTRELPEEHTVHYDVEVDFGPLGAFRVANLSSANDIYDVGSDLSRPLAAMLNNPFAEARIESIAVALRISDQTRLADVEGVTLDRNSYAPGDEVAATVRFRRYREPRLTRTIRLRLPDDLPEGEHTLHVGDWSMAQRSLQERRPRLFDPRSVDELLVAVQRAAETRMDRLYADVNLPGEGVTVDTQTIADAPSTVAAILTGAKPLDVTPAGRAVTAELEMGMVVSGEAEATVTVTKHPPRP